MEVGVKGVGLVVGLVVVEGEDEGGGDEVVGGLEAVSGGAVGVYNDISLVWFFVNFWARR